MKYVCASFLILISGMMSAQNNACVTLDVDFSAKVSEGTNMAGRVELMFQGNAFRMTGNGIEAYCDGDTVWTLDLIAKEVYIEPVTPDSQLYMRDLAPQLSALEDGEETSFVAPEGQTVHIKINSIKKTDGKDISSFRPTQNFDSSWVVTDLR